MALPFFLLFLGEKQPFWSEKGHFLTKKGPKTKVWCYQFANMLKL